MWLWSDVLAELGVAFVIRVKGQHQGLHRRASGASSAPCGLRAIRVAGPWAACPIVPERPQPLVGHHEPEAGAPRDSGSIWYLVANRPYAAAQAVAEYARRPGLRGRAFATRNGGWALPRRGSSRSRAWSRLFALCAMALLVVVSLASRTVVAARAQQAVGLAAAGGVAPSRTL